MNLKPKFANIISKKFTIDQNTFLSGEFDTYNYNIKIQTSNLKFSKVIVDDFILNISNNSGNINISSVKSNYFNGNNIEISLAKIDDFTNIDLSFIQLDNSTGSLQFEHTINPDQRSEFLIKELAFVFNGIDWQLKKQTKGSGSNVLIVGDKYTELKPTNIFSSDQSIEFNYFDDQNDFVFSSDFDNVEFSSIIPKPKNIFYEGKINGSIQLEKFDGLYLGSSDVSIESFSANSNVLGNAMLSIDLSLIHI